jgi:cupin fold WbuC family metalloprotein
MYLIKKSPDVYFAPGPIASIGHAEIDFLRTELPGNMRGRVRINLHPDHSDFLHEMFIAIRADSYIRPHKHPHKSEAFHIIYGDVDVVVFDDAGSIQQIVPMSAGSNSKPFYYRMSKPLFHTLLIKSEILVVHEITNGPFSVDGTTFASFSPTEDASRHAINSWQTELSDRVRQIT